MCFGELDSELKGLNAITLSLLTYCIYFPRWSRTDVTTTHKPNTTEWGMAAFDWPGIVSQHVGSSRFGVVQIVVHDTRVVQVEPTERIRFAARGTATTECALTARAKPKENGGTTDREDGKPCQPIGKAE